MSHLIQSVLQVKDIESLRKAAKILGGELEQSKVFTSYTGEFNPCEYRIKLPGVNYQVGIVREGSAFLLSHDPFGGYGRHDGHKLVAAFGNGLSKLSEEYTAQVVTTQARKKIGWTVVRKRLKNGRLQLRMVHA